MLTIHKRKIFAKTQYTVSRQYKPTDISIQEGMYN